MTSESDEASATAFSTSAQGAGDAGPTLRDVLSGARAELGGSLGRGPLHLALQLTGIAVDLVVTLWLLASGSSLAVASLVGFLADTIASFGVRALAPVAKTVSGAGRRAATMRGLAVAALALGVRGGAMGTAIALGSPVWVAATLGVAMGWFVGYVGHEYYVRQCTDLESTTTQRWTLAAIGIVAYVVLLHILTMQTVPVMPQEAYYWNYSVHPDFSYHDHPPMVAWMIAAGEAVLGHGPGGVRLAAFACGLLVIYFAYLLARRLVDRSAAMVAAALAAVLPYFYFATGEMMTPDAPLTAAWAAALYFFHRALVGGDRFAWLGIGVAMGLGMLSKYTIALLGPAALVFCLVDKRARGWLIRPEPYLAVLVAAALFAPVVYWNYLHDWASFKFQTEDRFGTQSRFSLHRLLGNMLVVATPLPLIALPLLLSSRWTKHAADTEPEHAEQRNRRFAGCFVLVPLAVFAWDSLRHLPRLNWTGPIWLAVMPMLGWCIVHARVLRAQGIGSAVRLTAPHLLGGLLVAYALVAYYVLIGFPRVGYPKEAAPLLGWSAAAREVDRIAAQVESATGAAPVVVGMDAYQIASELSFYGTPRYLATGAPASPTAARSTQVTAIGKLFGGEGLMFAYWNPPAQLSGRTLIMVARSREDLVKPSLSKHFGTLDPDIYALPLTHAGYGGEQKPVDRVYYRIGYRYESDQAGP